MRQFKIVPVPTTPARPAQVPLSALPYGTVVEWWRTPSEKISCIVVYHEGWYERGLVDRFDFSRTWDRGDETYVTPIGVMRDGTFIPTPAPEAVMPLVRDLPLYTLVDFLGAVYLKIPSATLAYHLLNMTSRPDTTSMSRSSEHAVDLRCRVLGTLQPMTLADFEVKP